MTDASLGNLSSRGSVIFTLTISALMLFSEPKEVWRMYGWRSLMLGLLAVCGAVGVALAWHPQIEAPPYVLPLCATLLYTAVLWGLFEHAVRHTADTRAAYYKGAWERATESWQMCTLRVRALENPPPPLPHPDQLELPLGEERFPRRPARLRVKL